MLWHPDWNEVGHAIQKGAHIAEGALGVYGMVKGGWELASVLGGLARQAAPFVAAGALL